MWRYTIELPSRWLKFDDALKVLGVSENKLEELVKRGLVRVDGTGTGQRFDGQSVAAVAEILTALSKLLKDENEAPKKGRQDHSGQETGGS